MSWDVAAFEKRLFGGGFAAETLGIELIQAEPGKCRIRLPFKTSFSRGDGLIHGGVIGSLIDNVGAAAVWTYNDIDWSNSRGVSIGFTVNFLQAAVSCDLIAESRVVRRGRSVSVIDVEVSNPVAELVATGTVTYRLSQHVSDANTS